MADISLTASTRANLLTAQKTTALAGRTARRLATGRRVNRPIDGTQAFFLAKSLTDRASDLLAVKDTIGQSLSAVGGALNGIDAITSFINQLKATAQGATDQPAAARAEQAARFDELRSQLNGLATDVNYDGVKLLAASPDDLIVPFDSASGSSLTISGVASDSASLGIGAAVTFNNFATDADVQAAIDALDNAVTALRSAATELGSNANVLNTRLDFTQDLAGTLAAGAGALTGADLNEEAANLMALNVARELSLTGLNLVSQSQQAVLKLF